MATVTSSFGVVSPPRDDEFLVTPTECRCLRCDRVVNRWVRGRPVCPCRREDEGRVLSSG